MGVCQVLGFSPPVTSRCGVTNESCVVTVRVSPAIQLNPTGTAWAVVLTAGLLGAGLALSTSVTAAFGRVHHTSSRRTRVADLVYVALIVGFFALALLILKGVDRL